MRKFFLGLVAATIGIFLFAAPATAAASEWSPEEKKGESRFHMESTVPEDAANALYSAYDLGNYSDSSRYVYVANLPEGANVQTAARSVAKAWNIEESAGLSFYDVASEKVFLWPASEANTERMADMGGKITVDQLANSMEELYQGESGFPPIFIILFIILFAIAFAGMMSFFVY